MSDPTPVPAGAIQIEDDEPQGTLAPAAPEPAAAAPAESPAVASTEGEEIDLTDPELAKDQKRISGLIAELSRKREEVRTLKPKAQQADALQQQVQQTQPYVDFLRANPDLMKPRQPEPAHPAAPAEDAEAIEAAKLYDFYDSTGKPDAVRGRAHLAMVQRQAEALVRQHVQPIQQSAAHQQAQANYTALVTWKDAAGKAMVDKNALDGVWRHMISQPGGLETLATREGALTAAATARGFAGLTAPPTIAPPVGPPIHTESSGGQPKPRASLTPQQEGIARERGWKPDTYAKLTQGFTKGRPTILEED